LLKLNNSDNTNMLLLLYFENNNFNLNKRCIKLFYIIYALVNFNIRTSLFKRRNK